MKPQLWEAYLNYTAMSQKFSQIALLLIVLVDPSPKLSFTGTLYHLQNIQIT